MQSLLSILDIDRHEIDGLLMMAEALSTRPADMCARGTVIGLLFYSDSLRTRVGFETAAARMGAQSFLVTHARFTPVMVEPESVHDAVRSIAGWCDALLLRHPKPEVVQEIDQLVDVPVINCGNGADEHPTQALVDLFAMSRTLGRIDGTTIALVGDLKNMRAAHSLMLALSRFSGVKVRCISPRNLELPARYAQAYIATGNYLTTHHEPDFAGADLIYVAGLPQDPDAPVPDDVRRSLVINASLVSRLDSRIRVMCPLPRIDEIDVDVDALPQAAYFEQSRMALFMRQAILARILAR